MMNEPFEKANGALKAETPAQGFAAEKAGVTKRTALRAPALLCSYVDSIPHIDGCATRAHQYCVKNHPLFWP
tara:strand:- start:232 stop:447 length:216 start_codon:yes stop_codon:yes gene_type:complete